MKFYGKCKFSCLKLTNYFSTMFCKWISERPAAWPCRSEFSATAGEPPACTSPGSSGQLFRNIFQDTINIYLFMHRANGRKWSEWPSERSNRNFFTVLTFGWITFCLNGARREINRRLGFVDTTDRLLLQPNAAFSAFNYSLCNW